MTSADNLLVTKGAAGPTPVARTSHSRTGLPASLLKKASKRLQVVCLSLIATVLVAWYGAAFAQGYLASEFATPYQWGPPADMILASIVMFFLARGSLLSPAAKLNAGLVYMVFISCGFPLSTYWNTFNDVPAELITSDLVGLTAVAPWMFFFFMLVPTRPRNAAIALFLSAMTVPVTMVVLIRVGDAPAMTPANFFFAFVLPHSICAIFAYMSARIIWGLGKEVRRAQEMGSYHLLDLIGRGGMGEVWRAKHNMLARPAAVKLIRSDAIGGDPDALRTAYARFEREAQVTAGLQSPHTVQLYDFGMSDDGTLYYVMEHLDGIDLESMVKRFGPLRPERTVHVMRQACHSLGEAHRRGLVHRDIKPANIYLCKRAFECDFVKVLDFGLVKKLAILEGDSDTAISRAETITGTPAYIAPEVALGSDNVDGRADLYALGCVGYWLLSGRRVFEEENAVAMLLAHVKSEPRPPGEVSELLVPLELDALILACLAKDPANRPSTAEDLDRKLSEIQSRATWAGDRAAEWWRKHLPVEQSRPSP